MTRYAIINPRSGGGRTKARIGEIRTRLNAALGETELLLTDAPLAAERLTREVLKRGATHIIGVGGDGTISECVNGFFEHGRAISPAASFSPLMSGTGGDFKRTFGLDDDMAKTIARIAAARARPIDVAHVTLMSRHGKSINRHFINIGSFGLSGAVVNAVNRARLSKMFGGRFAYFFNSAKAALTYRSKRIRLKVDGVFDDEVDMSTVAICNGKFFGGGMMVAPDADPADGAFDIIVLAGGPKRDVLRELNTIYTGDHIRNPRVKVMRGQRVIAAPIGGDKSNAGPVLIELDGEQPGQLPATFTIMPGALQLRV